jgi:hypothetical protein
MLLSVLSPFQQTGPCMAFSKQLATRLNTQAM